VLVAKSSPIFIVPNGTFIFELVIFIIVFGIVAKFILPSINKVMNDRDAQVRAAAQASDEGRAEADRLRRERVEVLDAARAEARTVLEEANAAADRARESARERGEAEHERIVTAARAEIESERGAIRDELIAGIDTLIVAAAERAIGARVEASRHAVVIERARETARAEVA
jgi:F-type H+-transporting ATPase subunit b